MACAAYVDLNPIRAALAETLEQSDFTSVQRRIEVLKTNASNSEKSQASNRVDRVDDFLSPVSIDERTDPLGAHPSRNKKRCSDKGFLAIAEADYLEILDWLARNRVAGKRGSTPVEAPAVFERLGIEAMAWSQMVQDFGRMFKNVATRGSFARRNCRLTIYSSCRNALAAGRLQPAARLIITFNLRDFARPDLVKHGWDVMTPIEFTTLYNLT